MFGNNKSLTIKEANYPTDNRTEFGEKLLLLKNEMNTEEGKRIAEKRHDYIKTFLEEIRSEICAEK